MENKLDHKLEHKFKLGEWVVDSESNTIENSTSKITLEPKMMNVLAYLCEHAGQVISSEQLLIEFWKGTFYGDSPVQKCIAMLRKKLGDSAKNPIYIETVQRRGYRIIGEVVFLDGRHQWGETEEVEKWSDGSPYRGLKSFSSEHAPIYFGRNKAIAEVIQNMLLAIEQRCNFLLVLGKSGSGKSSLMRAGVLPYLSRPQGFAGLQVARQKLISPDLNQFASGLEQLVSTLIDLELVEPVLRIEDLVNELEKRPESIHQLLNKSERIREEGIDVSIPMLIVDQFEQYLQSPLMDRAKNESLIACMSELARSQSVLLVVMLRNDFYSSCSELKGFIQLKEDGRQYDLLPATTAELAKMIRLPAQAADLVFERNEFTGERLDDVLLNSAASQPDALPLMEYTLDLLFEHRTEDNVLTFANYESLGGLEGAIAQQAEIVFESLEPETQPCWDRVMHQLVNFDDEDKLLLTGQTVPCSIFKTDEENKFISKFVDARLFVVETIQLPNSEYSKEFVSIAHESLLRHWNRVTHWAQLNREALVKRNQLAQDCKQWVAEGKQKDFLLPIGKKIQDGKWLQDQSGITLSDDEQQFIDLSFKKQARTNFIKKAAVSSLAVLTLFATSLAFYAQNQSLVANNLREKAEGLIDFMLGDLREQLEPIGKLDVLEGVGKKTLEYYEGNEDESLLQQANSLKLLAEIDVSRGDFEEGKGKLEKSLEIIGLVKRDDLELLYLVGNVNYWLGYIAYLQKAQLKAENYFLVYQDYSKQLVQLDPKNTKWLSEYSASKYNLGVLFIERGDHATALTYLTEVLAIDKEVIDAKGKDKNSLMDYANTILWISDIEYKFGSIEKAGIYVQEAISIFNESIAKDGLDYEWKYLYLTTINVFLDTMLSNGQFDYSKYVGIGKKISEELFQREPDNEEWLVQIIIFRNIEIELALVDGENPINIEKILNNKYLADEDPSYKKYSRHHQKQKFLNKYFQRKYGSNSYSIESESTFHIQEFDILTTPKYLYEKYLSESVLNHDEMALLDEKLRCSTIDVDSRNTHLGRLLGCYYFYSIQGKSDAIDNFRQGLAKRGYFHPHLTSAKSINYKTNQTESRNASSQY